MRLLSSKSLFVTWVLAFACDPGSRQPVDSTGTGGRSSSSSAAATGGRNPLWDVSNDPPGAVDMTPPKTGELDVFAQNKSLGRGINIGNCLDAPSEGAWGVTLMPYMFEVIAKEGFDSIRLPVKWSAHADLTAPYTIDPKFFERVDWAIAHVLTRGLKIVVDMHHYGNDNEEGMFDQPVKHHDRFIGLWKQIADHYKNYPKELFLEPLNEPRGALEPLWNQYMADAVAAIRETNPGRTLIVGGIEWNKYYRLKDVVFPDSNIIATYHYYNPYCFTHQNQYWEAICKTPDGSDPAKAGTAEWPVTWPKLDQNPAGTESSARARLESDMQAAAAWAKSANRPLYMGEFGVSSTPSLSERADYTGSLVKAAERLGISFSYWQFTSDMGVWDGTHMQFLPEMLKALKSTPDAGTGGTSSGGASSGGASNNGGTSSGGASSTGGVGGDTVSGGSSGQDSGGTGSGAGGTSSAS